MGIETNRWGLEVDEEHPHLGGYVAGGDPQSACPQLWAWLIEKGGVRSVLDVGCGEGHALAFFREHGCEVQGVDGIEQESALIVTHDYARGPYRPAVTLYDHGPPVSPDGPPSWSMPRVMQPTFDLVWSCEFVEHVEERFLPNYLATFSAGNLVLFTHALPGQPGHHHVNCRTGDYWRGVMGGVGYQCDEQLTEVTRELAGEGTYYGRTGLAFRRHVR